MCVYKCGHCPECLAEKRKDYTVRSYFEMSFNNYNGYSPKFLTLTFDEEHYLECLKHGTFVREFQLFMKRLRKYVHDKLDNRTTIHYIRTVEIGKNGRLHFHVALFGVPFIPAAAYDGTLPKELRKDGRPKKRQICLWPCGFVKIKKLSSVGGLKYVCKYISKPTIDAQIKAYNVKRKAQVSKSFGVPCESLPNSYLKSLVDAPFVLIDGYKYFIGKYLCSKLLENSYDTEIVNKFRDKKINRECEQRQQLYKFCVDHLGYDCGCISLRSPRIDAVDEYTNLARLLYQSKHNTIEDFKKINRDLQKSVDTDFIELRAVVGRNKRTNQVYIKRYEYFSKYSNSEVETFDISTFSRCQVNG